MSVNHALIMPCVFCNNNQIVVDKRQTAVYDGVMNTFITETIAAYGNNRLAKELGVSPQAVSKWAKKGEIPPRRVPRAAKLMRVSKAKLCPELYGRTSITVNPSAELLNEVTAEAARKAAEPTPSPVHPSP